MSPEISRLLDEYDDWAAERDEIVAREEGPGRFAELTGKSEDDWESVRSEDYADSDDAAVNLLHRLSQTLRGEAA